MAPRRSPAAPQPAALSVTAQALVDQFHLEDIPSHLLRRAHFQAEERFNETFADESITPRQKAALIVVAQHPGLTQNALAAKLFMDRNTVADMVKRLCASGLLTRVSAETDQRAYQLYLGVSGAELLDRVLPRDAEVESALLARLPEEYRPLFMKCLRLLVSPLQDQDDQHSNRQAT